MGLRCLRGESVWRSNSLDNSSVTIQGSFFDGNFATDGGGAVFMRREGGSQDFTLDIRNTTFLATL